MRIPAALQRRAAPALGLYAAINFAAFFIGAWFWYGEFFLAYPIPAWAYPFVPDCPLANGLFGAALVWAIARRPSPLLNQLAAVACVKYGTWTMTFWALYWSRAGDFAPLSVFLFAAHLGLTIQGLAMLRFLGPPDWRVTLAVFAWFIAGDIVDYAPIAPREGGFGWYPPLPLGAELVPAMLAQAIAATWVLNGALALRTAIGRRSTPTQT